MRPVSSPRKLVTGDQGGCLEEVTLTTRPRVVGVTQAASRQVGHAEGRGRPQTRSSS